MASPSAARALTKGGVCVVVAAPGGEKRNWSKEKKKRGGSGSAGPIEQEKETGGCKSHPLNEKKGKTRDDVKGILVLFAVPTREGGGKRLGKKKKKGSSPPISGGWGRGQEKTILLRDLSRKKKTKSWKGFFFWAIPIPGTPARRKKKGKEEHRQSSRQGEKRGGGKGGRARKPHLPAQASR